MRARIEFASATPLPSQPASLPAPDSYQQSSFIKMTRSLPDLPLELLPDILEWLLALGGKAKHLSAAYLAQSCRLLRSSEAGKRARYLHPAANLSLSVPRLLPTNLEYETEVLEEASWPPRWPAQPPPDKRSEDAAGLRDVAESCYERRPESSSAISSSSKPTCDEGNALRRTVPLRSRVSKLALDTDGTRCAVLYEPTAVLELIEIRGL